MKFPPRIEALPDGRRATERLRFMLHMAGLIANGKASILETAKLAGCDHSGIAKSINRGYFCYPTAKRLEALFGRSLIRKEDLMEPLTAKKAA